MLASGLLFPKGVGVEPQDVIVEDYMSIQNLIGGCFDCVRADVTSPDGDLITVVGYVHDEGLILDLETNWLASALFSQEIRGDVVIVSGTSPSGEYDGDNYDLPKDLVEFFKEEFVGFCAKNYNEAAILNFMMEMAIESGIISDEELDSVSDELELLIDNRAYGSKMSDESLEIIQRSLKWGREQVIDAIMEDETENFEDELQKFMEGQ
jgi:hypothetical protein